MNPQPDPPWQEALERGLPVDRTEWAASRRDRPADDAPRWAEEAALNEALATLPPAPRVSTNFASRVQAAIRVSTPSAARSRGLPRWSWLGWAVAAGALVVGLGFWRVQVAGRREVLAQAVAEISRTAGSAGVEVETFAQFEVIRGLGIQATPSDDALVAALSQ